MTRKTRRSILSSIVAAGSLSIGAAADPGEQTTDTPTGTETGTSTTTAAPTSGTGGESAPITTDSPPTTGSGERTRRPENRVAVQISPATHVSEFEYRNGAFHITVYSALPTTLTLTESVVRREAGAGTMNVRQVPLNRGATETSIAAPMVENMAVVTLTTPQSINNGTGAFLQAGAPGITVFGGPATWGLASLGAAGTFAGTAYGTRRYYRAKKDEQDETEVDRIA